MNAIVTIIDDDKEEQWLRISINELKRYRAGNLLDDSVLIDGERQFYYLNNKKFNEFLDLIIGNNTEVKMDWIVNNTEQLQMFVHPEHWFRKLRHYDKKRD